MTDIEKAARAYVLSCLHLPDTPQSDTSMKGLYCFSPLDLQEAIEYGARYALTAPRDAILQPGTYALAYDDCRAVFRDGRLVISRKPAPVSRCGDCLHCAMGFTTCSDINRRPVCKARPKPLKFYANALIESEGTFYTTYRHNRACEKFIPKPSNP